MREFNTRLAARVLAATGYRFSKDFRWGITPLHRLVYWLISTPLANVMADGLDYQKGKCRCHHPLR